MTKENAANRQRGLRAACNSLSRSYPRVPDSSEVEKGQENRRVEAKILAVGKVTLAKRGMRKGLTFLLALL